MQFHVEHLCSVTALLYAARVGTLSRAFVLIAILRGAALGAEQPNRCRHVAGWDAERDLVAYELRRGDCSTPGPALTGRAEGRRRKSIFELHRISTGELVDAADCEISFAPGGGEAQCDLQTLLKQRPSFKPLRPDRTGAASAPSAGAAQAVSFVAGALVLSGPGAPRRLDLAAHGTEVVEVRHTRTHVFARVLQRFTHTNAPTYVETLLRFPGLPATQNPRWQRDLLEQAAYWAEQRLLDSGRMLVAAAHAQRPLDAAALSRAFCSGHDVVDRLASWRRAAADLAPTDRLRAEKALAERRCFPGIDLARYDASEPQTAIARRWLEALRRGDSSSMFDLTELPLLIRGLWDHRDESLLLSCGGRSGARRSHVLSRSELDVHDRQGFEKAAPCLFGENALDDMLPALSDGVWPPDRGNPFEDVVGSIFPIDATRIPRRLKAHARALKSLAQDRVLIQAVTTDNNGFTITVVVVVNPGSGAGGRVTALFVDELFRD